MAKYTIKQGDLGRLIKAQLEDDLGFIDLTIGGRYGLVSGVIFRFRLRNSDQFFEGDATVEDAENGIVSYAFADGETDEPGYYLAEFVASFANSVSVTFPSGGYIDLYILDALG